MTYRNTSIDYNNVNLFLCLQNDISKKKNKKLGASMESMRRKHQHLWGSSPLTLAGLRAGARGVVVGLLLEHVEVLLLLFSFCFVVCMWEWGLEREVRLVGFCEWEEGLTSGARRGKGWITHHPARYRCHCVMSDCLTCSIIPSNKVMCFEDLLVLSRSSQTIQQVRSNYLTKFDGA